MDKTRKANFSMTKVSLNESFVCRCIKCLPNLCARLTKNTKSTELNSKQVKKLKSKRGTINLTECIYLNYLL